MLEAITMLKIRKKNKKRMSEKGENDFVGCSQEERRRGKDELKERRILLYRVKSRSSQKQAPWSIWTSLIKPRIGIFVRYPRGLTER